MLNVVEIALFFEDYGIFKKGRVKINKSGLNFGKEMHCLADHTAHIVFHIFIIREALPIYFHIWNTT